MSKDTGNRWPASPLLKAVVLVAALAAGSQAVQAQAQIESQTPAQTENQAPAQALAQVRTLDSRQNAPGEFDFYVLSLSWSPSFCAKANERGSTSKSTQVQCGGRPYSFVVHGLWPQYERGFPNYCTRPAPRLNRNIVSSMLDLMPAPGLIFNEWDKHGTCSGLEARPYFETVRKARAVVKIPEEFLELAVEKTISPADLEQAFIKANPGLSESAISVSCDSHRLSEIRICMSKDLQFRSCEETNRRSCRRETVSMPPVRGG
jgi:ribonuclease T2